MGIFSRLFRVGKGQVSAGVEALEEATFETTLRQTIRDMEKDLDKLVRSSAEALSHHNRLEAEYKKFQTQAADWEDKAMKALQAGKEELARKCLAKKQEDDSKVAELESSVESSRKVKERLIAQRGELVQRIEKAKRDASTLIARKNAARAQKKVSAALAGAGDQSNAFATLERFSRNVEADEAQAAAYDDLSNTSLDAEFEKELAELGSGSNAVDADLAALKAKMNG